MCRQNSLSKSPDDIEKPKKPAVFTQPANLVEKVCIILDVQ